MRLEWTDIAYSFLVDDYGTVYEGRGWDNVGSHTKGVNFVSFGAAVVGNYTKKLPTEAAISAMKKVIQCGIDLGKIANTYELKGHRDAKATKTICPGDPLYNEIKKWDNFPNKLDPCGNLSWIERVEWTSAKIETKPIKHPVSKVFVYHSNNLCVDCANYTECRDLVKKHNWTALENDFALHFIIDGLGLVYDMRGYSRDPNVSGWMDEGRLPIKADNDKAYGIAFIGKSQTKMQVETFEILLKCGVQRGYLVKNYQVLNSSFNTNDPKEVCNNGLLINEIMQKYGTPEKEESFTIPEASGDTSHCNFQEDTCDWYADEAKNGWKRHRGAADEAGMTGPLKDADNNINGYYFLADASKHIDGKIKLSSALYPLTEVQRYYCLKFWYHMYGKDVKSLSIWIHVYSLTKLFYGERKNVLTITGNKGPKWLLQALTIDIETIWAPKVNFEFVASFGNYLGDIALDNIEITRGKC
ncbi:peptidoglycan-recognition protein LF-like [Dreissena polymorpha]|uniref:peptidoglycan-recognition protein LF-like n=1 Tax=Dreissena polymorpha TaxID=45954 RepID=UPI0022641995|nr:peptidoglycan-recognition protein LF-like [Dreissena polymorpha]